MKNIQNTTQSPSFFLGIDVGKKDLFCHIISPFEAAANKFDNSTTGINALISWVKKTAEPQQLSACLEQTGHYGKEVAKALHELKINSLYLVNPRRIKAFGNQQLRRNKSDTADAKLIAEFIESKPKKLINWKPPSIDNEKVTDLSRYADSMTRDNARLKTKCESATNSSILRSLKKRIKTQEIEIKSIRKQINKLISKNANLKMWDELLRSIPGIGEVGSHIVIAELPDINLFKDARQLAAWAGVTPQHHESGTSGRKSTPITNGRLSESKEWIIHASKNSEIT